MVVCAIKGVKSPEKKKKKKIEDQRGGAEAKDAAVREQILPGGPRGGTGEGQRWW
jgi:hypothetical protein